MSMHMHMYMYMCMCEVHMLVAMQHHFLGSAHGKNNQETGRSDCADLTCIASRRFFSMSTCVACRWLLIEKKRKRSGVKACRSIIQSVHQPTITPSHFLIIFPMGGAQKEVLHCNKRVKITHARVHVHVPMHAHVHPVYVHTHVHVHVHVHIHIHIHILRLRPCRQPLP